MQPNILEGSSRKPEYYKKRNKIINKPTSSTQGTTNQSQPQSQEAQDQQSIPTVKN